MLDNNFEEQRQPYPLPGNAETEPEQAEEEPAEEEAESAVNVWFEERADARADIDSAIAAWSFLDEVDVNSPDVLKWNLKRKLLQTKKNCLLIIAKSISELVLEKEDENEED